MDLPETFAYLLGLHVRKRQVLGDNERRYLVYKGTTRDGRKAAVIWRETEGWTAGDYKRDQEFISKNKLTKGMDDVYVNGDSYIPGAQALERLFKERMFAQGCVVLSATVRNTAGSTRPVKLENRLVLLAWLNDLWAIATTGICFRIPRMWPGFDAGAQFSLLSLNQPWKQGQNWGCRPGAL